MLIAMMWLILCVLCCAQTYISYLALVRMRNLDAMIFHMTLLTVSLFVAIFAFVMGVLHVVWSS